MCIFCKIFSNIAFITRIFEEKMTALLRVIKAVSNKPSLEEINFMHLVEVFKCFSLSLLGAMNTGFSFMEQIEVVFYDQNNVAIGSKKFGFYKILPFASFNLAALIKTKINDGEKIVPTLDHGHLKIVTIIHWSHSVCELRVG